MLTVKLPYTTTPEGVAELAVWQRHYNSVLRTCYQRIRAGKTQKDILPELRARKDGAFNSWLTLSALSQAKGIHKAAQKNHPDQPVIFGGRRNFALRSQGKLSKEDWQEKRLQPLTIEGHAKSFGFQGGNHHFTLEIEANTLWFCPTGKSKERFPLKLKLGKTSNYRDKLAELQRHCLSLRDTPFTIKVTKTHVSISWQPKVATPTGRKERTIALDLNPNRIGWAVLEKTQVLAWGIYDFPNLNSKSGQASNHSASLKKRNKRKHELSLIAKDITAHALHFQCGTLVTESLTISPKNHGKGRTFNRLVNNTWFRNGFLSPLLRRAQEMGLAHKEVNPAYSSKIGNALWGWNLKIPDPACAATEIGRRASLSNITPPKASDSPENQRKENRDQRTQGWKAVWEKTKPKNRADTPRFLPADYFSLPEASRPRIWKSQRSDVSVLSPPRLARKSTAVVDL